MTVKEKFELINRTGMMRVEEFVIEVTINDVRDSFGTTQVHVTPVNGKGAKWTPLSRVELVD